MKIKITILVLAFTGIQFVCCAQQTITIINPVLQTKTDAIFNSPLTGSSRIRFDFQLSNSNKMILELADLNQADSLPNIHLLVKKVWDNLQHVADSFSNPLINRRVDYYTSSLDTKIRIVQYAQRGDVYSIRNSEVTQLKVEQDTLRIRLFTRGNVNNVTTIHNYYVTFLLNNISELQAATSGDQLETSISLLQTELHDGANKKSSRMYSRFYALYDVNAGKKINPFLRSLADYGRKDEIKPYVQTSLQYVRGVWAPSAGLGIELVQTVYQNQELHFRLMWEPFFIFKRDASNKLLPGRNDFITFKYSYSSKVVTSLREIQFAQNISFGYLLHRNGDAFEPNTFKFALPGLQTKNILLEPEFFFNKFFKNFSPSLKLTLFFE